MKLKMVRIEYANRILVAKNFHIDNLILHYSEKLLFMHDNVHGLGLLNGQQRMNTQIIDATLSFMIRMLWVKVVMVLSLCIQYI